uniref:Uncharacterized protein n=1 Tax=Brassica oleracea var. oleracea TaxID=109376 RepID=A0A0D3AN55_BRAOL
MNLKSSPLSSPTNLKNLTSSDEPEKLDELRRTEQALSRYMCVLRFCRECERTALKANKDVRVALIHIGVVLGKDGCALAMMIPFFQMFAGGPLGTGQQCEMLLVLLVVAGVINGTAPNPVRLGEMCQQLGSVLGRPSWLPVSDFALKALVTEKQEILFSIYRETQRSPLIMSSVIKLQDEVSNTQDLLIPPSSNILEGMTPPLILSNTIMSLLFSFV